MTVATVLVVWCFGSALLAPIVGRAMRRSFEEHSGPVRRHAFAPSTGKAVAHARAWHT